ncbi:MAG TPA: hypothetical protein VJU61_09690 [Polyangiaceae bacterium]|nr:hypothetical protein [Polyangiaceae bacterium]
MSKRRSWVIRSCLCLGLVACGSGGHGPGAELEPTGHADAGALATGDAGSHAAPVASVLPVCSRDGWCWDASGPHGNTLRALAANSPSDVWAVGALGTTLHFDGTSWAVHWAPTEQVLRAIWLNGAEAWAVGEDSTVLHFSGEDWEAVTVDGLAPGVSLHGVWGDASGRLWLVGDGGTLFERRAGTWSRIDAGTTVALNAVWSKDGEAWAVGDGGTLLRRQSDAWVRVDAGTTRNLLSVHGRGSEIWLSGQGGELRRWNPEGARWERPDAEGTAPSGDLSALQVAGDGLVYTASSNGNVYVWDGAATCPVAGDAGAPEQACEKWGPVRYSGREQPLLGLWASGDQSMVVGEHGRVVSWQGRERRILAEGSLDNYLDVSGSSGGDVWIAGDRLLQAFGSSWKEILRDSPRALYAVQAEAAGQVLVAGTGGMARAYADAAWSSMDVRADALLRGLWSDGSGGWLVGSRGSAWGLLNHRLWTPTETPTDRDLLAVWSFPAGPTWAVGKAGVILRHDGIGWAAIPSGPDGGLTVDLRGVWGSAKDDVWAVGTGGTAVHWNGSVWTKATSEAAFALNDVWGRSENDAWAVGSSGTILHFDGESWQPEHSGSEHTLNAIWGNQERVWAVGEHGTILVKTLD